MEAVGFALFAVFILSSFVLQGIRVWIAGETGDDIEKRQKLAKKYYPKFLAIPIVSSIGMVVFFLLGN